MMILLPLVFSTTMIAQKGSLDEDIVKYSEKLRQYPRNERIVGELRPLLQMADQRDQARIESLRSSGQPDIWYDLYLATASLAERQKRINSLPEPARSRLAYPHEDLEQEMEMARHKAAAYLHAHAEKLLQVNEPALSREAFRDLELLAAIDTGQFDISPMIYRSILQGAGKITYELSNETRKPLTREIISALDDLVAVAKAYRHRYEKSGNIPDAPFDFILKLRLTDIRIGTEQTKKYSYREVRDLLDEQGMKRDSITCDVKEVRQMKSAWVEGSVEFIDVRDGRTVVRTPVKATSFFSHRYASLKGDPEACSEETRALLKENKAAYPSGEAILMDAVKKFTLAATGIITGNENPE